MRVIWVLAVALCGCITSNVVVCDEGLVCPAGTLCDNLHQRCVVKEQLDVCAGMPDDAECSYDGAQGICIDQVCFVAGCGNGVVDPNEVCDDGNTRAGDHCSSDCHSNETCGNGVIDVAVGEACDDGNSEPGDGCQETCALP